MAKTKLSKDNKRDLAQELFMNTDMNQKDICLIVGWTEKTFTDNKRKYNWEQLKAAGTVTSQKIIANLYKKLFDLSADPDTNADDIAKIASSIEKLSDKRITISHYINVFKDFAQFLLSRDIEVAKTVNGFQKEFIHLKLNGN